MNKPLGKIKKCPKCGNPFICYASTVVKCHCTDITLSEKTLKYLKNNFSDCVCLDCLKSIHSNVS